MSLNEKYYAAAHQKLSERREENRRVEERRREEVLKKLPEYARLEAALAENAAKIVPIIIERREDTSKEVAKLRDKSMQINGEIKLLLASGGFPVDYLEPVYSCPVCLDKGSKDGRWCGCFMREVYAAASRELNEQSPMKLSRFEDFMLSLYPDEVLPKFRQSARKIMTDNYSFCREYADRFDGTGKGILMMGATGLGKTHLSLAIANRVIERGYSAIYGSVPELLRMLNNEQFGRSDKDTMSLLTGCELLILDDLGAENNSDYSVSLLYEIINARVNRSIPMIVSTNFDVAGLKANYNDRICSRLLDMKGMFFVGSDNRAKSRK